MYQIDKIQFLQIGVQGENDATNIEIDMTSWVKQFPDAVFHILFKPYNASVPSPMLTTYADGVLTWTVGVGATAVVGVGYTEVRAQDASTGLIKKSRIIPTSVDNSVSGVETTPPASYQEWVTDVLNAGTDAKNSAAAAMAYSQGKQIKFEIGDDEDPDGMAGHLLFYFKDEEDEEWEDYLDLGPVDVYATVVAAGYTGTKAQWIQSIQDAEANAQKSEKYAVGKVNGTDVGSTDPTYHNNSKYYSEQAAGSATDANAAKVAAQAAQSAAETAAQTNLVEWLEQNITNPDSPPLDRTLSSSSAATPADITGDLKSALDSENGSEIIYFTKNKYIDTNPSSGVIKPLNPGNSQSYQCAAVACVAGDKFTVTADTTGGTSHYQAWAFVNSEGGKLTKEDNGASIKNKVITAPTNAVYLVVNAHIANESFLCKNKNIPVQLGELDTKIDNEIDDVMDNIVNTNITASGIPAKVIASAPGSAECTTTATTVLRYKKNLMTTEGSTSSSFITRDENGVFVINGIKETDSYIDIQKVELKGGVTYRVDGSPRNTVSNTGLCLRDPNGDRKAYDNSGSGATYTPEEDETVKLQIRLMEGTYSNVKFYPVLCENATAQRFSPSALELTAGYNEVLGLDFASLSVTYGQSKIEMLNEEIEEVKQNLDNNNDLDIMSLIEPHQNENGQLTSSFTLKIDAPKVPKILCMVAQYTGETAPTIKIQNQNPSSGVTILNGVMYVIGSTREPTRKSWRIPPASADYKETNIIFTIPEGTAVTIRDVTIKEDQRNRYKDIGINIIGHAGVNAPANTVEAFQYGAELGYNSMVTIPKILSDGTAVCFHDDSSIGDDLCWMDGTAITGTDNVGISNYSYDYITENFRIKSVRWGILHVPTMDDFFRVCSLTGMNPILSVHSSGFGASWATGFSIIKALAKKWGVLHKLGIKSGSDDVQSAARSVFGKEIGCYIWLNGASHTPYSPFTHFKTCGFIDESATDLTGCEYNLSAEYFYSQTKDIGTYYSETIAQIAEMLEKGFKISVWESSSISGAEMSRLIGIGVTEFTVDNHISMGLDW